MANLFKQTKLAGCRGYLYKRCSCKTDFPEPGVLDLSLTQFLNWVFIAFSYSLVPVQMSPWVGAILSRHRLAAIPVSNCSGVRTKPFKERPSRESFSCLWREGLSLTNSKGLHSFG